MTRNAEGVVVGPESRAVMFPLVTDAMVEAGIRMQVRLLCAEVSGLEGSKEALTPHNRAKMKAVLIAALEVQSAYTSNIEPTVDLSCEVCGAFVSRVLARDSAGMWARCAEHPRD